MLGACSLAAIFPVLLGASILFAASNQRMHFTPKFVSGEVLRYQVDMRTVSTGNTTTPIANPEGQTKVSQTISLLVRLEVLGSAPTSAAAPPQTRFRVTYEKSSAQSESDAFNPDAPSLEDQYSKLEGGSIEFTLLPEGHLAEIRGLEDIFPQRSETDPILSWVQAVSIAARLPREGITLAQKWSDERPLPGGPLADLFWRTQSTYLRDDTCGPAKAMVGQSPSPHSSTDSCAVILTHFEILRHGSPESNATPQEYLRNGLRTSGSWTGSGESLDSISLATGLLESSTQTSTQKMDYQIISAATGSRIHHVAQVESQSEIRLVSAPAGSP